MQRRMGIIIVGSAMQNACGLSSTAVSPYFRGHHEAGCDLADPNNHSTAKHFGTDLNQLHDQLSKPLQSSIKSKSHRATEQAKKIACKIRSVSTLYKCCISSGLDEYLNDSERISDFFIDESNIQEHWKGFNGLKLFVGEIYSFNNAEKMFIIHTNSLKDNHYINIIVLNNADTYFEVMRKIKIVNPKIKHTKVAVFSFFDQENRKKINCFGMYLVNASTRVNSSRYYYIIRGQLETD